MEEVKFTYMIEKGSNNGYVSIFKGYDKLEEKDKEYLLYFHNDNSLIEALKIYKKGAVIVYESDPELVIEGARLSKKLNLQFLHP